MTSPACLAIGDVYERQVRRRLDEDWELYPARLRPVRRARIAPWIKAAASWLATIRAVGASFVRV